MRFLSRFRNNSEYWKWGLLALVLVVILVYLILTVILICRIIPLVQQSSVPIMVGVITIAAAILLALIWLDKRAGLWDERWRIVSRVLTRGLCWVIFFPVVSVHFLGFDRVVGIELGLEIGIVAIAAALGGASSQCGVEFGSFVLPEA